MMQKNIVLKVDDLIKKINANKKDNDFHVRSFINQYCRMFQMTFTMDRQLMRYIKSSFNKLNYDKKESKEKKYLRVVKILTQTNFILKEDEEEFKLELQQLQQQPSYQFIKFSKELDPQKIQEKVQENGELMHKLFSCSQTLFTYPPDVHKAILKIADHMIHSDVQVSKFKNIKYLAEHKEIHFEKMLVDIAQSCRKGKSQHHASSLQKKLESLLNQKEKLRFKPIYICQFGSKVNGTGSASSDTDLTILTNSYVDERECLSSLYRLMKEEWEDSVRINQILSARTPVIKLRDNHTDEEVDVIINNIPGILNSMLINTYCQIDSSIPILAVLVKEWAKAHELISEKRLSSYAFILLLLHFLIKKKIIANIQVESSKNILEHKSNQGKSIIRPQFKTTMAQIRQSFHPFNIYQQFRDFIAFLFQAPRQCQQFRISLAPPALKSEFSRLISIEDPFDKTYDPGRWSKNTDNQVFYEAIKRSQSMLKANNICSKQHLEELFKRK